MCFALSQHVRYTSFRSNRDPGESCVVLLLHTYIFDHGLVFLSLSYSQRNFLMNDPVLAQHVDQTALETSLGLWRSSAVQLKPNNRRVERSSTQVAGGDSFVLPQDSNPLASCIMHDDPPLPCIPALDVNVGDHKQ